MYIYIQDLLVSFGAFLLSNVDFSLLGYLSFKISANMATKHVLEAAFECSLVPNSVFELCVCSLICIDCLVKI